MIFVITQQKCNLLCNNCLVLKCPPDDEDKMVVLMKSMEAISCFENTLEDLQFATITFNDIVTLILEKDRQNKDSTLSSGISSGTEEAVISTNR